MKLIIETQNPNTLVVEKTVMNLTVNPFDTEGSKIPLSLFTAKGDLLVGKGDSNPAPVGVGSDGQVLVSDSSEDTGVKWKTMQLGTITLTNSESFAVPSGTVVTNGTVSGTFRIATSADTTNLYVTSENILSGEDGVLYAASSVSCIVKVTSAAVAIGDKLTVSASAGIAVTTTGSTYFAIAVTGKAAGADGTVICILVNTIVSTLDVPGGGTGRPSLTANAVVIGDGTNAVKLIPTHQGVLYASGDGAEPVFGAAGARTNLGLGNLATINSPLPIANGGHGATDAAGARTNLKVPVNGMVIDSGADLNNVIESGFYRCNNAILNSPPNADWGQLIVAHAAGDTIAQMYLSYNNDIWTRGGNPPSIGGSGVWTAWSKLARDKGSATVSCPFTSTSLTVAVSGLPAGALVWIEPAEASRAAFYASDVHYSSHSANSLVLHATTNPGTISIVVGWIG